MNARVKMTPQQVAQKVKAGRGWLIVRNSGTLADTDYERVADEIVRALNDRPRLIEALRDADHALTREDAQTFHRTGAHDTVTVQALVRVRAILRELGEAS